MSRRELYIVVAAAIVSACLILGGTNSVASQVPGQTGSGPIGRYELVMQNVDAGGASNNAML